MDRLNGMVAIITGGSLGIGRACAPVMAKEGQRLLSSTPMRGKESPSPRRLSEPASSGDVLAV